MAELMKFFRAPALSRAEAERARVMVSDQAGFSFDPLETEWCYYVRLSRPLTEPEQETLHWLLAETFSPEMCRSHSFLNSDQFPTILEIGPRLNFTAAWSTTAAAICRACGLTKVEQIIRSKRIGLSGLLAREQAIQAARPLYDRMTEDLYAKPLDHLESGLLVKPVRIIPLIEQGMAALRRINQELGLSMDEQDIAFCYNLFVNGLKRNPTDVELCQLGQANSEHSRHHFFKGRLIIDGEPIPEPHLMAIVKAPWEQDSRNSVIAFNDDSSAIIGPQIIALVPSKADGPAPFVIERPRYHRTLTAETHNYPSGVEPYQGAMTGGGGLLRDLMAVGQSGLIIALGAGYCTAHLLIPGHDLPWEQEQWPHPDNLAAPLDIMIRASDGASDYGNCFGVPIIYGYARSFALELPDERRAWYKPIMYVAGTGQIDARHIKKGQPEKGMLVVQVGGPAYRIGLGGGSASSMVSGANTAELDFNAVQRGDPQMEQRLNRLVRACVELGDNNPIISIHDLGAGGDCNALPELVEPAGARINLRDLPVGDHSLSVLEIWCNESQERNAFLIWPDKFDRIMEICEREGIPCAIVGQVTGDGYLILHDENDGSEPVSLPLNKVLGELPQKTFELERVPPVRQPLQLPAGLTVRQALDRVLRLISVGSKRFLTTKVDRSVTGLIAQQQCVGPNQLTLSDYAVVAQSHFGLSGTALSLGEQPIKGLLSPQAMGRLAVAEALLNLVGAGITQLQDVRCSANWMLAAKEPGEGVWLYEAACAMRDIMLELGMAVDGGKDSLSMAAKVTGPSGTQQTVKAPGELVIGVYAPMTDIRRKATPDCKAAGNTLLYIDLSPGKNRLGGSALAQVFQQVGNECPDVEDVTLLRGTFEAVQQLVKDGLVLSVHDCSDGGLIIALLEMAFAGNVGLNVRLQSKTAALETLFNEEPGLIIECQASADVLKVLAGFNVPAEAVGMVGDRGGRIVLQHNNKVVLDELMTDLRCIWEETSHQMDAQQANPDCVAKEARNIRNLVDPPPYHLTFEPKPASIAIMEKSGKPKVAILREGGSNGDREMASAFFTAGLDPWDVTMTDLLQGRITLDEFRGAVFVGGFSYADVLDAAKGWAGVIRFNAILADQFQRFYERSDTFSLGVCNGCQLMALLGWVPRPGIQDKHQPRFVRNTSGRFESRFSAVHILESPAIMLQGMAGSTLGIWVAHGEGRFQASDGLTLDILDHNLAPLVFAGPKVMGTEQYPFNPNGSPQGIAALCSPDGRHLAMMPHPERTFLTWQWPWLPEEWRKLKASPWLRLFQNAYDWCTQI